MKKRKEQNSNTKLIEDLREIGREGLKNDPSGSYTGVTEDGEKPLQDADDL